MQKWIFLAAFVPGLLCAQMQMGEVCRPGRGAHDLNLTEAQQKQITTICRDSFKKMSELRETWNRAEDELKAAFDESPVDQHKSNDAIEHLTAARSDLFRATSQMDLKIRTVLTDEQWQALKNRERHGGPGRPGGPDRGGWRRGGPPKGGPPTTVQPQQPNR
jgi:Spy/CpxP family protein refolding chaperone